MARPMNGGSDIPIFDGESLPGEPGEARDRADEQVGLACHESGFMVVARPPGDARLDAQRRATLRSVFDLPERAKQRLYRQRFVASSPNRHRGLAPAAPSGPRGTARSGRRAELLLRASAPCRCFHTPISWPSGHARPLPVGVGALSSRWCREGAFRITPGSVDSTSRIAFQFESPCA